MTKVVILSHAFLLDHISMPSIYENLKIFDKSLLLFSINILFRRDSGAGFMTNRRDSGTGLFNRRNSVGMNNRRNSAVRFSIDSKQVI